MSLKGYLTFCYVISLVMVLLAGAIISVSEPGASFDKMLIIASVIAAVNTFGQIWRFRAHGARRTSARASDLIKWTSWILTALLRRGTLAERNVFVSQV